MSKNNLSCCSSHFFYKSAKIHRNLGPLFFGDLHSVLFRKRIGNQKCIVIFVNKLQSSERVFANLFSKNICENNKSDPNFAETVEDNKLIEKLRIPYCLLVCLSPPIMYNLESGLGPGSILTFNF
jgi:hypothetical protein